MKGSETMPSDDLLEITDKNFDTLLKEPLPILIDFTAAWCAPCRAIAPHVAAIARDYAGRVAVGKCDTDSNTDLVARLDVRAMPTLLLFKGGQVVESVVGLAQKEDLKKVIDKHV